MALLDLAADWARRRGLVSPDPAAGLAAPSGAGRLPRVLRDVSVADGRATVTITPTYTGCPALDTMRDDLVHALRDAGYQDVEVRIALHPAWTTDWISEAGRRKLVEAGIAPPAAAPDRSGPVPVTLGPGPPVACTRCGSVDTAELSRFGATACRALRRCPACREPFEHMKAI